MAVWSKASPLTAICLSPLPGFECREKVASVTPVSRRWFLPDTPDSDMLRLAPPGDKSINKSEHVLLGHGKTQTQRIYDNNNLDSRLSIHLYEGRESIDRESVYTIGDAHMWRCQPLDLSPSSGPAETRGLLPPD